MCLLTMNLQPRSVAGNSASGMPRDKKVGMGRFQHGQPALAASVLQANDHFAALGFLGAGEFVAGGPGVLAGAYQPVV